MYPRHSQITRGKGSTHSCDVCAGKNRVSAYACRRYDFNVHRRSDVKLAVSRRCRQPRKVRIGPHLARRGWPAPKPSGSTASSLPHHVGLGEGLGARGTWDHDAWNGMHWTLRDAWRRDCRGGRHVSVSVCATAFEGLGVTTPIELGREHFGARVVEVRRVAKPLVARIVKLLTTTRRRSWKLWVLLGVGVGRPR